jgi:uncharacterized damage-inducible protein DinB
MPQPANYLLSLVRHMAWADACVWKAVMGSPQAMRHDKIGSTLHHLHAVQHLFLQGWTGTRVHFRERTEFPTLGDVAAWARQVHGGVEAFLEAATEETLEREFRVPWAQQFEQLAGRSAGAHTLGESVLQVVLHSQHHRGQVCTFLREAGGEPPTIDFIVWLWAGRPEAAQAWT